MYELLKSAPVGSSTRNSTPSCLSHSIVWLSQWIALIQLQQPDPTKELEIWCEKGSDPGLFNKPIAKL